MLILVGIIFEVHSSSTVHELSQLSILKKRPEILNLTDETKEKIRSIHAKENIKQDVKEFVQEYPRKGSLYVYDENSRKGVWFDKRLIDMSSFLQSAAHFHNVDANVSVGVEASQMTIQKVFDILSNCAESKSEEAYPDIIKKQTAELNFVELLSVFNLAWHFFIEKKVLNILIPVTQEKMNILFEKGISLAENDIMILQKITEDEGKKLFSNEMFNSLLERIKKHIRQHFLSKKFSNKKIFPETKAVLSSGYNVSHLALNKNGSRLWYTCSEKAHPDLLYLYALNMKQPISQVFTRPKLLFKKPCWVDEKTIAYIAFESSHKNQSYELILHDCIANKDTQRLIKVVKEKRIIKDGVVVEGEKLEEINLSELLCSNGKIMLSYYFYADNNRKHGVGICGSEQETIKTTPLLFGKTIKLLPIKKNTFAYISYDSSRHTISLYEGVINEDNFIDDERLETSIDINISEDIFSQGVINSDGSKMAFIMGNEICLLSFKNLKTERFQCEGIDEISALAFSPDDELLMIAGNKEIIIFDMIEKEIISALSEELFDRNDSIGFSKDGMFFAVGGYSENRDEFLMVTSLKSKESDPDLKKLYLNLVDEMAEDRESIPFGEKVFLHLLSLRSKNQKLSLLTDAEKEVFQSFDEDIQEMLTEIKYIAPGQMSEMPRLEKKSKLPQKLSLKNDEENRINPPLVEEKKSYLRTFLEKAWQASNNYWNSLMKYFPSSG